MPSQYSGQTRAIKANYEMQRQADQDARRNRYEQDIRNKWARDEQRYDNEFEYKKTRNKALDDRQSIIDKRQDEEYGMKNDMIKGSSIYNEGLDTFIKNVRSGKEKNSVIEEFDTTGEWQIDDYQLDDATQDIIMHRNGKQFKLTPFMQQGILSEGERQRKNTMNEKLLDARIQSELNPSIKPQKTPAPRLGVMIEMLNELGYDTENLSSADTTQNSKRLQLRDATDAIMEKAKDIQDPKEKDMFITKNMEIVAKRLKLEKKPALSNSKWEKFAEQ